MLLGLGGEVRLHVLASQRLADRAVGLRKAPLPPRLNLLLAAQLRAEREVLVHERGIEPRRGIGRGVKAQIALPVGE
jgi:hypothetical protein